MIGARGSGKTALADLVAAGAYALTGHLNDSSFVRRASHYLGDSFSTVTWESGETTSMNLVDSLNEDQLDFSRLQYLSQQFVEQLCSAEGLEDELLSEIERVIFQAHPIEDRMGAASFRELLNLRLERARTARLSSEQALLQASQALTSERARKANLGTLIKQRDDRRKLIEKDRTDRKALTSKGTQDRVKRLEDISLAVDAARRRVEQLKRRHRALLLLRDRVADFRDNSAPAQWRELKRTYSDASLTDAQWENFKLKFAGDVDSILLAQIQQAKSAIETVSGPSKNEVRPDPNAPPATSPYIPQNADLAGQTLTLLEKEMGRLQQLVGIDAANAKKLAKLSEKIAKDEAAVTALEQEIRLAEKADARIADLLEERKRAYGGIFNAIIDEQLELTELYSPLAEKLKSSGGELGKLSFDVRRSVNVEAWAEKGESLLDLRKIGPFKGKGTLLAAATDELLWAWEKGTSIDVAEAMASFRQRHEQAIIDYAPVERSDQQGYARWARSISDWLYDTSHIAVSYGLQYGGVDVEQLSPGTRGIVLLLLYVVIDTEDDRPLIIDQPEENLDPKSIYEELVEHFKSAKLRRQIVIITHNANLVVNTDADQVIIAKCGPHRPGALPELSYESGGLENPVIRKQVCEILEGGETAFKERAKRLRVRI